jgi:hypothetical protein
VDVLRREADEARRQQHAASQALINASQMAVATTRQQRTSETTAHVKSTPAGNVTISSMEQSYAYMHSGTNNGYTREQVCVCVCARAISNVCTQNVSDESDDVNTTNGTNGHGATNGDISESWRVTSFFSS